MNLQGFQQAAVTDFRGPWTSTEPTDVPASNALSAANVQYRPGEVMTRSGFGVFFALGERARSLFNWIGNLGGAVPTGNALVFINPANNKARLIGDLSTPAASDLFTLANMTNAVITHGGMQMFIAPLKDDGTSAGQLRIARVFYATVYVDKAFPGPISTAPVITETGTAGECTGGTKKFGYLWQSRTGGWSPLCPVSAGTFAPVSATLAGGKTVTLAITAAYPAEATAVYPCMTTSRNQSRWYKVPGLSASMPGGTTFGYTFNISISDEVLEAEAEEVTDRIDAFAQDGSGNGPFNPHSVFEVGNRIAYATAVNGVDQLYISDVNNPQAVTADQHVFYLPGFRKIITGREMRGGIYLFGPSWTYATSDNGEVPALWPAAQLVDAQLGAPGQHCIDANTAQGYIWVANPSGLWLFNGGTYAEKPISYNQDDQWRRINWAAPTKVIVKDNPAKNRVRVVAPLDGASDPTHILTFDYQQGADPDSVAFSIDNITSRSIEGLCLFKNPTTSQSEELISVKETPKLLREMDTSEANWWLDDGAAVSSHYETALIPGKPTNFSELLNFMGTHLRLRGSGLYSLTVKTLDAVRQLAYPDRTLESAPGREIYRGFERGIRADSVSVRVANSGAGWWALSTVKLYFKEWMKQRL